MPRELIKLFISLQEIYTLSGKLVNYLKKENQNTKKTYANLILGGEYEQIAQMM